MRIEAENLHKRYGEVTALDGLSLSIPPETTFGVLGTNGAGKTTLFELLVGLDRPDEGTLTVGGREVEEAGTWLRDRIGYLPEHVGFPAGLTGREVLRFNARVRGISEQGRIPEVLDTVGLDPEAADRAVSGYSNGMGRRLGLAGALLARPSVLILDEPTAGLDPRGVAEFHRIVERVRERTDATVVLSSHVLGEVERLCDRVAIFHDGRVVAEGSVDELVGSEEITVQLRPADAEDAPALHEAASTVAEASTAAEPVTVDCPPERMPTLFAALDGGVELGGVTVERDGLEGAFHEAVPGDRESIRKEVDA